MYSFEKQSENHFPFSCNANVLTRYLIVKDLALRRSGKSGFYSLISLIVNKFFSQRSNLKSAPASDVFQTRRGWSIYSNPCLMSTPFWSFSEIAFRRLQQHHHQTNKTSFKEPYNFCKSFQISTVAKHSFPRQEGVSIQAPSPCQPLFSSFWKSLNGTSHQTNRGDILIFSMNWVNHKLFQSLVLSDCAFTAPPGQEMRFLWVGEQIVKHFMK